MTLLATGWKVPTLFLQPLTGNLPVQHWITKTAPVNVHAQVGFNQCQLVRVKQPHTLRDHVTHPRYQELHE